ncbi:hypothetical protein EJ04DRAFT_434338 [Polyplosphaeria fusca]|uniref:Uncharacterized protein n=1 Tax=Polyplosphaeria fusca TaxID=682080 RepID=A0A9P4R2R1_9PLEO|nr:hypothetical protein EJ04DRAFT_434338 [Polyplosphaeria fusca]
MSLDEGTNPLRGGTIEVDGIPVVVPKNTLVNLPAAVPAWPELFADGGAPNLPGSQQYTATIAGNRVSGRYIAGLIYIAQNPVRSLEGFITEISPNGHFKVAGSFNPAGVIECVINDPLGVYASTYTANPLWSVDPENPSIRAFTGFPMCIPRSDSDDLCPLKNRPIDTTGKLLNQFTFSDPATIGPNDPDANVMAPLMVGDFVTFSGQNLGDIFEVNNLIANIGFYTAPGSKPSYVTVEEALYGIRFPTTGGEIAETRAVAFTTDPSTSIQFYAEDKDPCTGNITQRNLMLTQPAQTAPIGRARFRFGATNPGPAPRNFGFKMSSGVMTTKNNLTAGLFIQPVTEFIFPELTNFGINLPPLAFDTLPFLAQGYGPYEPGNPLAEVSESPDDIVVVGQLDPWPGQEAPTTTTCAPPTPTDTLEPSATPTLPPSDVVFISSATMTKTRGGNFIVEVTASSDNPAAKLFITVDATVRPLNDGPMSKQTDGTFHTKVLMKGTPLSVTVSSDLGGSANVVPTLI